MSISRPCPYRYDYENCRYAKYYGEPVWEKCGNCDRCKKENKDVSTKNIYKNYIIEDNKWLLKK